MKLTILGHSGPYPGRGEACSGYLVQSGGKSLLLDLGPGTLSRLQEFLPPEELDAVILTHLHPDHIGDFMVMRYALLGRGPVDVYAPGEPTSVFDQLTYTKPPGEGSAEELSADERRKYSATWAHPLSEETTLAVGGLQITFSPASHSIPCFAVKVEGNEATLVFTGDTRFAHNLVDFADSADLLLAECNAYSDQWEVAHEKGHLTAEEVGDLGRKARVKRILLTHLFPEHDYRGLVSEASTAFGRSVEIAEEMKIYSV